MKKLVFASLLILTSCFRVGNELEPQLNYAVQDRYLKSLPSPFPPLTEQEAATDWGREDRIGLGFAHELDLYQAITGFKRSSFLLPPSYTDRKLQLEYDTLLCYYYGRKYPETIYTFDSGSLRTVPSSFAPYQDLLVILYDSYNNLQENDKADKIMNYMEMTYPAVAQKLALSKILLKGDIPALQAAAPAHPDIQSLLNQYELEKKSTRTAQLLNVFVPGTGYLYVGQTQSAITAFLLNGLFIWATCYFFQHGNTAAGIIFASVEAGWYFGGIYGAGQEAKFYNERVYERLATPMMNENRYFPILMLNYGF
ncbi:MAG TPA: tetratricopeptide repeat protein [Rhabdochlamydiaceae bacterium]|nr:tetratricopeptide repeat protein [Rhabdochlamydiaceae bacterium]